MPAVSVPLTYSQYYADLSLTALIDPALAAPTKVAAAKVGLFKNATSVTPTMPFSAFDECDFTGYALSATVVWGPPINEADGSMTCLSPAHLFQLSATTTTGVARGVFVTDGVASPSTNWLAAGVFSTPFSFENVGDGFSIQVGLNQGAPSANAEIVQTY